MKALYEHLLELLGKPVTTERIDALSQELGSPDKDSLNAEFDFPELGLSIETDSARFSELVFFTFLEYPEFRWKRELPFGIEATDRVEDVEQKLFDKRLLRKELSPDRYRLVYRTYPYELAICFDGDCEQLSLITVKYAGLFTDTAILPMSFILRLMNGTEMKLFEKGIEIPEFNSVRVTTTEEGQHAIELAVFRGDAESAEKNEHYSNYIVHQLPKGPTGVAQAEVKFEVMIDGNLKVTAVDTRTKKNCAVTPKIVQ